MTTIRETEWQTVRRTDKKLGQTDKIYDKIDIKYTDRKTDRYKNRKNNERTNNALIQEDDIWGKNCKKYTNRNKNILYFIKFSVYSYIIEF